MTSETIENYDPGVLERLRVAAEYVQIGFLILVAVTFFIYPITILQGRATRLREVALGMVGMLFWAYAASVLVR